MNLHQITIPGLLLWWYAQGGNGRTLGTHLWEAEWSNQRPIPYRASYYSDTEYRRYVNAWLDSPDPLSPNWRNYAWIRPLCGKTSRSSYPTFRAVYNPQDYNRCPDCYRIATSRGRQICGSRDYPQMLPYYPHRANDVERLQQRGITL